VKDRDKADMFELGEEVEMMWARELHADMTVLVESLTLVGAYFADIVLG
jgi:hypothetical protein